MMIYIKYIIIKIKAGIFSDENHILFSSSRHFQNEI